VVLKPGSSHRGGEEGPRPRGRTTSRQRGLTCREPLQYRSLDFLLSFSLNLNVVDDGGRDKEGVDESSEILDYSVDVEPGSNIP